MKKLSIILFVCSIVCFQYCSSSKKASTTVPAHISITYTGSVQQTITANCSPCHIPPKGNKKALDTYDAAKNNITDVITRINLNPGERGFMPFKHAKLSDSLINVFVQWKADGLLEK